MGTGIDNTRYFDTNGPAHLYHHLLLLLLLLLLKPGGNTQLRHTVAPLTAA